VLEGPEAGRRWTTTEEERCSVGSHLSNAFVIDEPTVSRFHCELLATAQGVRIDDMGSSNGTLVDGVRVVSAWLKPGSEIRLGKVRLRFELAEERRQLPLMDSERFGGMVGGSVPMRRVFHALARCAKSDITVLVEGETGTGKEGAAAAIHSESDRSEGPFVIVDCSALPTNLFESELFGHEKGSFTGAVSRRIGAFERAHGGTIFLDEIGELPRDLQPKLLRVLEQKTVRRVGSNEHLPVDVRVVAATNRDLRAQVNEGHFRSDLYFRLAILKVTLPPLRERQGDLPLLVHALLTRLGASASQLARFTSDVFLDRVRLGSWPGNVRELRNYLESCLVMDEEMPIAPGAESTESAERTSTSEPDAPVSVGAPLSDVRLDMPLFEAKNQLVSAFERAYLVASLKAHEGNKAAVARAAGVDRGHLYRLLKKYGIDDDERG
jgi:DNA-binding NtrC family response regulator